MGDETSDIKKSRPIKSKRPELSPIGVVCLSRSRLMPIRRPVTVICPRPVRLFAGRPVRLVVARITAYLPFDNTIPRAAALFRTNQLGRAIVVLDTIRRVRDAGGAALGPRAGDPSFLRLSCGAIPHRYSTTVCPCFRHLPRSSTHKHSVNVSAKLPNACD